MNVLVQAVTVEFYVQISIFILHNVFKERSPGYLLLKALRSFIEVDVYASLQMHTEATIASGRQKLTHFYEHLAVGNPLFYFTHLISSKSFLYRYTLLLRIIMTQRPKNGIFPRSIPYSISLMTLLLRG